uniref:Uncharacterized protein n=1 Tax=Aegilops tauschii TaxID=37682 RepID=N1R0Z9_AEGTA
MELLKQNMADDYDERAKFEAAATEEAATEDEIRMMRISEEATEVAAEEEMMMMGLGDLAEEDAEELTKSGEQNKRRRRRNRSAHDMMVIGCRLMLVEGLNFHDVWSVSSFISLKLIIVQRKL